MPIRFARLRIAGFKSFAEPAVVEIRPGLTGIVGPNGCGKSNVVEALRWAMGENSARSLRGGEMDDVIFAGSAARPSRNLAEVTLTLESGAADPDSGSTAFPQPFHEQPELQVSRRIERGAGSAYRLNGREVRARDVQTLFADLGSGAHSSAMVSQGRVGAVINARPEERRAILEEAAGITGLHARRHEAELKLRAADANLARSEDLRGQLDQQFQGLKRQARQASRYRNLSGDIRAAEAALLSIQRARTQAARDAAHAAWDRARQAVAAATEAAHGAATTAATAAAHVPPLREAEAEARTALERHRVAGEQVAAEENRARAALAAAEQQARQIAADLAHAEQAQHDAAGAGARLAAEAATLVQWLGDHPARAEAAATTLAAAEDAVRSAEAAFNRATEAAAQAGARAQAVAQELAQATPRARRLEEQRAGLQAERARLEAQAVAPAQLQQAAAELAAAQAALVAARAASDAAERDRAAAQAALAGARERFTAADGARARLAAEAQALAEVLAVGNGGRWTPVVDAISVPSGLEAALGAALGEELASATEPEAPRHWRALPPLDPPPALPDGATPLSDRVQGPAALGRALSQIGLVADTAAGAALHAALRPGQMLVCEDGAVWRWDGHCTQAGTPTQAAIRLQQRNRLADVRARLAAAEAEAATSRAERGTAETAEAAAIQAERAGRDAGRSAEQALERTRGSEARLRAQAETAAARLTALVAQIERITPDCDEAKAALARAQQAQAALPDHAAARAELDRLRAALAAARSAENNARAALAALASDHATRTARRQAIAAETTQWVGRAEAAAARVVDLAARRADAEAQRDSLATAPATMATRRAETTETLAAASAAHRRLAAELAQAVGTATAAEQAARTTEAALAAAREQAVRAEGAAGQADHAWGDAAERILERLGANPALPDPPPDLGPDSEERARRRFDKLQREREEMGPVNLRAEIEAGEIETRIAAITTEREELSSAIAKLRASIGHLNREGRERLTAVFAEVDRNFQSLFTRMFGGGRAHLAMVGSDDPLSAGLEIYTQPPGKKLATLSLLSGGEQALTALSLIFAVFRCNPAPVCVLDEVDAPLDDANVDRFCALLEDMVRETKTRFLVVTHHALTMARMDRLYGVTMQERGVSRLLSVDLQAAAGMLEPPRMAAE